MIKLDDLAEEFAIYANDEVRRLFPDYDKDQYKAMTLRVIIDKYKNE